MNTNTDDTCQYKNIYTFPGKWIHRDYWIVTETCDPCNLGVMPHKRSGH